MSKKKASITAIITASMILTYSLYKPSDHEAVSESPTVRTVALGPPIDDAPKSAVVVKQVKAVNSEVKPPQPIKKVVAKPKTINVEATFYVSTCRGCSGFTASGYDVRKTVYYGKYRIIALDKSIPLETIVNVKLANGNTFDAIVLDRGGAIKRGKADILVASYDEAIRLGRQKATITILKLGGR